ncbi:hypothetical protein [Fundidesulfovibrio putealis]|uniref:hypothetical protein n=1 Tax=Fundidesulfovibrio putealis TaxID=270496 RepID=UPI000419F6EF|nr:hypothetical protein [Fundidesulfovibrio putealis]
MSIRLGPVGQKWLKSLHILFGGSWVASGVCITVMGAFQEPGNGAVLHGFDLSRKFIDDFLVIPAAVGCLLTSVAYSLFTGWGWFRHRFVTVKWCICIFGIVFGTFWLGPWLNALPPLSGTEGLGALSNRAYAEARTLNFWGALFQNATLVFALFISTLKPWGRTKTGG